MREWPYTALNRDVLSLGSREISWLSEMYNPIHPSSRQCTYTIHTVFVVLEVVLNIWDAVFGIGLDVVLRMVYFNPKTMCNLINFEQNPCINFTQLNPFCVP